MSLQNDMVTTIPSRRFTIIIHFHPQLTACGVAFLSSGHRFTVCVIAPAWMRVRSVGGRQSQCQFPGHQGDIGCGAVPRNTCGYERYINVHG